MEKLRYWNILGEVFELDQAWGRCLEMEDQAAELLKALESQGDSTRTILAVKDFLSHISPRLRSITPRPPARPLASNFQPLADDHLEARS